MTRTLTFSRDVEEPLETIQLREELVQDDAFAHRLLVKVYRGADLLPLEGWTVKGTFLRLVDHTTVLLNGEATAEGAILPLPAPCYALPGQFALTVKLHRGEERTTVLVVTGRIRTSTSDTYVDPDAVVPSLQELLALMDSTRAAAERADTIARQVEADYAAGKLRFRVLGHFNTLQGLMEAMPQPTQGDAWHVGTPGEVMVYNGEAWQSIGSLAGEGVPAGGTAGQVLTKASEGDYDTQWQTPRGLRLLWEGTLSPGGSVTLPDLADIQFLCLRVNGVMTTWGDKTGGGVFGGMLHEEGGQFYTCYVNARYQVSGNTFTLQQARSGLLQQNMYTDWGAMTVTKIWGIG